MISSYPCAQSHRDTKLLANAADFSSITILHCALVAEEWLLESRATAVSCALCDTISIQEPLITRNGTDGRAPASPTHLSELAADLTEARSPPQSVRHTRRTGSELAAPASERQPGPARAARDARSRPRAQAAR